MFKRILLMLIVISIFYVQDIPQIQAQICSTGNGAPTTIIFINKGSDEASIFWVNFDCQEQFYRAIIPGETYIQQTYDGHQWIVRNSDSQELGRGSASSETEIVIELTDVPKNDCTPIRSGERARLTIFNDSDQDVEYLWVQGNCEEFSYGVLAPNQSVEYNTFNGHIWVLRTMTGEFISSAIASTTSTVILSTTNSNIPESPLDFVYHPDENWEWAVIEDSEGCIVRPTTTQDGLDPFYQKMCDYRGIPIVSSNNVPDLALQMAWNIMANMLQGHSQVVEKLLEVDMRIGIVAQTEGITVLPEYAFLRNDTETNWDERARGLGGNPFTPLGSGAEENLLCYENDGYFGESIFLHEFAHTMKDGGIILIDPTFDLALTLAYQNAVDTGLWADTYALTNIEEYWAEGVQSYFNTNLEAIPTNGIHNFVNTRAELAEYDPTLYGMIDLIFGGFEWTPVCP